MQGFSRIFPAQCSRNVVVFWKRLNQIGLREVVQEQKFSPKRKFLGGCPCGHPAKNFGQALQILEKQAFWNGHPARTSMKKLLSEKLRADFPFPSSEKEFFLTASELRRKRARTLVDRTHRSLNGPFYRGHFPPWLGCPKTAHWPQ